ncbi:MAG: ABC transporter substrate-binding protein [Gammaproteobacteria bacterium]|nr:ABC transporter substrate-binding protein [Gammaproteobacteria bacterium]
MNDKLHPDFSRREILKLSALFTAAGALPLLDALGRAVAAEPDAPVRVGYLPITDAAPFLVAHHRGLWTRAGLQVERPRLFRSWAQLVEAFISGQVNVVHMLSPMTVYARYGSRSPSRVVAWNHIDGSAIGVAVRDPIRDIADLGGRTLAVPFWYSVHNIILQVLLRKHGLEPVLRGEPGARQVRLVVLAPSDMVPALASGRIAGYIVAEPFVALGELRQVARVLRLTGDVWKNHACCVVQMHDADIDGRPDWVQKVVDGITEAEAWSRGHRAEVAHILSREGGANYTPHEHDTLLKVLDPPADEAQRYAREGAIRHPQWQSRRIDFQPYPYPSYTKKLVELLKQTVVEGDSSFLAGLDPAFVAGDLVEDRFVRASIGKLGGMAAFGLPDGFSREEIIAP